MNATLAKQPVTYKLGTLKFVGRVLSRRGVKLIQDVYNMYARGEVELDVLLAAAKGLRLRVK
jgi:hypothetical protein